METQMCLQIRYICERVCDRAHLRSSAGVLCFAPKNTNNPNDNKLRVCVHVNMCVCSSVNDEHWMWPRASRPSRDPHRPGVAGPVCRTLTGVRLGEESWQGHRIQPPLIWGQGQCLNTCPRLSGARGGLVIPCKVSLLGSADWTGLVYSRTNRTHVNSVRSRAPVRLSSGQMASHSCWLSEFWVRVQNEQYV